MTPRLDEEYELNCCCFSRLPPPPSTRPADRGDLAQPQDGPGGAEDGMGGELSRLAPRHRRQIHPLPPGDVFADCQSGGGTREGGGRDEAGVRRRVGGRDHGGGGGGGGGAMSMADTSPRGHNNDNSSSSSVSAAAAAAASMHEVQPHQHRRTRRRRHRHRGLYDFDEEEEEEVGGDDHRHQLSVKLRSDLHLPPVVCDKLFSMLHHEGLDVSDETAAIFADTDAARLRNISVRGSSISDKGLSHLLAHSPFGLDIHHCQHLRGRALELINAHSSNLVSLNIGNSVHILPDYIMDRASCEDDEDSLDEEDRKMTLYDERGYILRANRLKHLVVKDLYVTRGSNYMELLLRPLPLLTHLDLSGLTHNEGLGDFSFLRHLNRLASLVLHNILTVEAAMDTICSLRTLRHLDISHSDDNKVGEYGSPNRILARLVCSLTQLTSLDISGTNLAGTGAFESTSFDLGSVSKRRKEEDREDESVQSDSADSGNAITRVSAAAARCDIPGLISRVDRPLDFLGLYKTKYEACCRKQIPAIKVSGDSTEQQILVAGRQYLDRPAVLENVLNDLFHIFRYETCRDLKSALDIILMAMDRHPAEKVIQISGSASLYYIVKSEIRRNINIKMKRKVLSTLLNGMFAHRGDSVMMRNGCLTLCQFTIPQDVVFDYERLVRILLHIVSEHTAEENSFVQRAGIYLLNSLACQV